MCVFNGLSHTTDVIKENDSPPTSKGTVLGAFWGMEEVNLIGRLQPLAWLILH